MRPHAHVHEQIARSASAATWRARACHTLGAARRGTRRPPHRVLARAIHEPGAGTGAASDPRDLTSASAGEALTFCGKDPGALANAALAFAFVAPDQPGGPTFGAGAAAAIAIFLPRKQ